MNIVFNQTSSPTLKGLAKILNDGFLDILIHIQQFLAPVDIISLRLTSKALSYATRQRSVWMNALCQVCIIEGVCKASFPLEKMSIDDLEHVALSPHRLAECLRRSDGRRLTPFQSRVLHPRDVQGITSGGLFLAPGGRFLVTSSFYTLYLWDLGATASSPMKSFPLAELSTEVPARLWCIGPTPDWNGICLFTVRGLVSQAQVVSYEIYPDSHTPLFRQVGVLVVSGTLIEASLSVDIIALHHTSSTAGHGPRLTLWKYTLNMGVTWAIDLSLFSMCLMEENIITFHEREFTLWTIPTLHTLPGDTPSIPPLVDHHPQLSVGYPYSNKGEDRLIAVPSPWLQKGARTHLVFFNPNNTGAAMSVARSIDTSSSFSSVSALLTSPVDVAQALPSGLNLRAEGLHFLHVSDGRLVQAWTTDSSHELVVDLISMPTQACSDTAFATLWSRETSPPATDALYFDFCPTTGRLVVDICSSARIDPEIRVLDFLVPRSFL